MASPRWRVPERVWSTCQRRAIEWGALTNSDRNGGCLFAADPQKAFDRQTIFWAPEALSTVLPVRRVVASSDVWAVCHLDLDQNGWRRTSSCAGWMACHRASGRRDSSPLAARTSCQRRIACRRIATGRQFRHPLAGGTQILVSARTAAPSALLLFLCLSSGVGGSYWPCAPSMGGWREIAIAK